MRTLVAVPGSFNPPHVAHLALMRLGIDAAGADAGVFVLSAKTVDKEQVTGLLLEDRLWLLCRLAQEAGDVPDARPEHVGVVATNRGLYVDQATALAALAGAVRRIVFVVGFDKIVQIFDQRYYDDRDAALRRLFERAAFLVAPRDTATPADLQALLDRPENRPFAPHVRALDFAPELSAVSSTAARAHAAAGGELGALLPPLVVRFLRATGGYGPLDAASPYAGRGAALDALTQGQSAGDRP